MAKKLTKQGLRGSLYAVLEYGFKSCERGDNLQKTIDDASSDIERLVSECDNLPLEILRIPAKRG